MEAQKLIAMSIGKIASSRQQRGGINLHKNLLVASVLHKARTTYMIDNYQTLMANRKQQEEQRAKADAAKSARCDSSRAPDQVQPESMDVQRGVSDCERVNNVEVPSGERLDNKSTPSINKENVAPVMDTRVDNNNTDYSKHSEEQTCKKSGVRDNGVPLVTVKAPLQQHNGGCDYVSQLPSCRCAGGKRRRSFVDTESGVQAKKPRFDESCELDNDAENVPHGHVTGRKGEENMLTETTQMSNLVTIFNSGFKGLSYSERDSRKDNSPAGHVNVYVSADRPVRQYVISDGSCATQAKEGITMSQTVIALAV